MRDCPRPRPAQGPVGLFAVEKVKSGKTEKRQGREEGRCSRPRPEAAERLVRKEPTAAGGVGQGGRKEAVGTSPPVHLALAGGPSHTLPPWSQEAPPREVGWCVSLVVLHMLPL